MLRHDLDKTNKEELKKELDRIQELLEEIEEEKEYMMLQSSHHINATEIQKYEQEMESVHSDIMQLNQLLLS